MPVPPDPKIYQSFTLTGSPLSLATAASYLMP